MLFKVTQGIRSWIIIFVLSKFDHFEYIGTIFQNKREFVSSSFLISSLFIIGLYDDKYDLNPFKKLFLSADKNSFLNGFRSYLSSYKPIIKSDEIKKDEETNSLLFWKIVPIYSKWSNFDNTKIIIQDLIPWVTLNSIYTFRVIIFGRIYIITYSMTLKFLRLSLIHISEPTRPC